MATESGGTLPCDGGDKDMGGKAGDGVGGGRSSSEFDLRRDPRLFRVRAGRTLVEEARWRLDADCGGARQAIERRAGDYWRLGRREEKVGRTTAAGHFQQPNKRRAASATLAPLT